MTTHERLTTTTTATPLVVGVVSGRSEELVSHHLGKPRAAGLGAGVLRRAVERGVRECEKSILKYRLARVRARKDSNLRLPAP